MNKRKGGGLKSNIFETKGEYLLWNSEIKNIYFVKCSTWSDINFIDNLQKDIAVAN